MVSATSRLCQYEINGEKIPIVGYCCGCDMIPLSSHPVIRALHNSIKEVVREAAALVHHHSELHRQSTRSSSTPLKFPIPIRFDSGRSCIPHASGGRRYQLGDAPSFVHPNHLKRGLVVTQCDTLAATASATTLRSPKRPEGCQPWTLVASNSFNSFIAPHVTPSNPRTSS